MSKYSILIVGCGSIGALKPDKLDSPITENVLTHAHACYNDDEIAPILYDINYNNIKLAYNKWNKGSIHNKFTFIVNLNWFNWLDSFIDIVIISTPTNTHLSIIKQICESRNKPKVIILEKPAGFNSIQAENIKYLCRNKGIKIIVNYTRRYLNKYHELQNKLQKETIHNCRVIYTRGLQREACHAIDLMRFFFGKFINGFVIEGNNFNDFSDSDLTRPVWMSFERCKEVVFQTVNGNDYNVFEIDIFTDKGRDRLIYNGLFLNCAALTQSIFGDYESLSYNEIKISTEFETEALPNVLNHAKYLINNDEKPICSIDDAIEVHKIIEKVKQNEGVC